MRFAEGMSSGLGSRKIETRVPVCLMRWMICVSAVSCMIVSHPALEVMAFGGLVRGSLDAVSPFR